MDQSQNLLPNGYLHLAMFLTILLLLILITDLGELIHGSGFLQNLVDLCVDVAVFILFSSMSTVSVTGVVEISTRNWHHKYPLSCCSGVLDTSDHKVQFRKSQFLYPKMETRFRLTRSP